MTINTGVAVKRIVHSILIHTLWNESSLDENDLTQNSWIVETVTKLHSAYGTKRRISVLSSHIAAAIPRGKSVLDLGCGSGLLAKEIMRQRSDIKISGIDIKPCENSAIPVSLYDGIRIPFEDGTWDVAMAIDALHHCDEPLRTLEELCRVSNRFVVIKDHVSDSWFDSQTLKLMDWAGNRGYGTALPYNYLSSSEWSDAFASLNLKKSRFTSELGIYPVWSRWVLDRQLHFLAVLEKTPSL